MQTANQAALLLDNLAHGLNSTQNDLGNLRETVNDLALTLKLGTIEEVQQRNYAASNEDLKPVANTAGQSAKALLDVKKKQLDLFMDELEAINDDGVEDGARDTWWSLQTDLSKLCDSLGHTPSFKMGGVNGPERPAWEAAGHPHIWRGKEVFEPVRNTERLSAKHWLDCLGRTIDGLHDGMADAETEEGRDFLLDWFLTLAKTHSRLSDALGFGATMRSTDGDPIREAA